jgi:MFS superfamily sulfate permease-like transporter
METTGKFTHVNRILHIGFILLACLQFFAYEEPSAAVGSLGISLAFDLFNQEMKWKDRPLWQKAWLLLIVVITFTGIITRFI